ncbi:arsenate reductase [Neisseria meningitidis]|uniref:arsenate reductase n=1 Tax=Neisseria meningitidis TaxID=487 RepID=UPI00027C848B|nr:arsenate reductase [Neisseria meningitidis]EJU71693.1 arsenate reductase/related protein [Neisseria meningitidis 92045]EPF55662.1 transcriptional regulator, Spx/MgsR family protein [Neisseria meningitidis NM134]MBW3866595.1 arsenate reductase [Neisseria meningitidis]MBW3874986.1 arsenate reductase [Neisseria meningitidis]MDM1029191.1 arsenate reductase [Neisseria meningitidis]
MIILHGIPNCDTVKKAKNRLAGYGLEFEFRDFKKQRPSEAEISLWLEQVPLEILLNKRGTTWRKLNALMQEEALSSKEGAVRIMSEMPSLIKRPVLEYGGKVHVGFSDESYREIFKR